MNIASVYRFGTTVELLGALALWSVVFLRAPTALRSRQQRLLLLAVVGIAGSITVYLDPVTATLKRTFVFAQSCDLFMNAWGVLSAALILDFVLAATSQRRPWLIYGLTTATIVVLIILNSTIAHYAGCVTAIQVPWYSPFWWILISAHLVAVIPCVVLCGRYAYRASGDRSLRVGLLLLASGFASSSVFWCIVLAFLLFRPAWLGALFPLNIGITAWLMTAGTILPLALESHRLVRNIVALWRLWSLWWYLVEAVPHVVLIKPRMRICDLFGGARSIYLRLYRRVIEIRDALLILRDYVRPEILKQARQHVTTHDLPEYQIEPTITACWLEVARQAKEQGVPPRPNSLAFTARHGEDLSSEIDFMIEIARARKSHLVISFPLPQPTTLQQRSQ
jgi:hypothetical protein